MLRSNRRGFTLIELLTVIAIIAILAAMVFAGFGMIREVAKDRTVDNAFLQIRNMAAAYYTQNGSYPTPLGGVLQAYKQNYSEIVSGALTAGSDPVRYWQTFQTKPYTFAIGIHDNEEFLDPFSTMAYDTDFDNTISLMEYLPMGYKANVVAAPVFPIDLPDMPIAQPLPSYYSNALVTEINDLLEESQRPFVYIAVNKNQAKAAARYWINNNDLFATSWNWTDPALLSITVPPPAYDAFVLVSQGRGGDTGGILAENTQPNVIQGANVNPIQSPNAGRDLGEKYHLRNLRAFFLATRDLDDDGLADLTYRGSGSRETYQLPPEALGVNGFGPKVLVYGYD